jgi:hypothetical protein
MAAVSPSHASLAERPLRRSHPTKEPSALAALAGICAGGVGQPASLPRSRAKGIAMSTRTKNTSRTQAAIVLDPTEEFDASGLESGELSAGAVARDRLPLPAAPGRELSGELIDEALDRARLRGMLELPDGGQISDEVIDQLLAGARSEEEIAGPGGLLAQLTKRTSCVNPPAGEKGSAGAGRARMWTRWHISRTPPGDPLTQIAPCANGKSRGPPGGSSGAKRHAPAPPQSRRAAEEGQRQRRGGLRRSELLFGQPARKREAPAAKF